MWIKENWQNIVNRCANTAAHCLFLSVAALCLWTHLRMCLGPAGTKASLKLQPKGAHSNFTNAWCRASWCNIILKESCGEYAHTDGRRKKLLKVCVFCVRLCKSTHRKFTSKESSLKLKKVARSIKRYLVLFLMAVGVSTAISKTKHARKHWVKIYSTREGCALRQRRTYIVSKDLKKSTYTQAGWRRKETSHRRATGKASTAICKHGSRLKDR